LEGSCHELFFDWMGKGSVKKYFAFFPTFSRSPKDSENSGFDWLPNAISSTCKIQVRTKNHFGPISIFYAKAAEPMNFGLGSVLGGSWRDYFLIGWARGC
jgi:hypothetical protein